LFVADDGWSDTEFDEEVKLGVCLSKSKTHATPQSDKKIIILI